MDKRRFDEFREDARILLVEDAKSVRVQLKALLAEERISEDRILEASSGKEGLERFRAEEPDIVFLDMMLPDTPGWEIGPRMLDERPLANVVLLTALESDHPQVRDLVSTGALEVLEKPVREADIRNVLLLVAQRDKRAGHGDPFSGHASA